MNVIALQGLHGGAGTSSIVAALADALAQTGQSVLCIDLDPRNLLRLYFNHEWLDRRGWAQAIGEGQSWHEGAFSLGARLDFLPYGATDGGAPDNIATSATKPSDAENWQQRLARLDCDAYRWVLLDIPSDRINDEALRAADIRLRVSQADPLCHALLAAGAIDDGDYLLINRFLPSSDLQKDLHSLWQAQYPNQLVPRLVHQDEAMFEALAHKRSVVTYRPESLAAQDIRSLAIWLLAQREQAA